MRLSCLLIDHEFRHNIVKVAVDTQGDSGWIRRIDCKILITTFKAIHGHAPEYRCNLIHIKNPSTRMVSGLILNFC